MQNAMNDQQSQLDALARQRGFKDYATMAAFERQRSESLRRRDTVGEQTPAAPPAPRQPRHEGLFGHILNAWLGATGQ